MRLNANHTVTPVVLVKRDPARVQIQIGSLRYTCTAEEATEFASGLVDAVVECRHRAHEEDRLGTRVFDWPDPDNTVEDQP